MSHAIPDDPHEPTKPDEETGFAGLNSFPGEYDANAEEPIREDPFFLASHAAPTHVEKNRFEAGPPPIARPSRFKVEAGGKNPMADTAERIGSAVGAAQREVRRTLELVRKPANRATDFPGSAAERANQIAREGVDRASRLLTHQDASHLRQKAAERLDEISEDASLRLRQLRREIDDHLSGMRIRAEELADEYPLQTIATVAGICFLFGAALRFRGSRRG